MVTYPAKLLLFGEYLLLSGVPALAMPLPTFFGNWKFLEKGEKPQWTLTDVVNSPFLDELSGFDRQKFEQDLELGLYFHSNIPVGYGLGSSGALVAALYDRYMKNKAENRVELRTHLSLLESIFHGKSSGIDPLVSFLKKNLWFEAGQVFDFVETRWQGQKPHVFLVDSGKSRQTAPLVNHFWENFNNNLIFREKMETVYKKCYWEVLKSWRDGDSKHFWVSAQQLSALQLELMPQMTAPFSKYFNLVSDLPYFAIKICGAGGGGFFLGFCLDPALPFQVFGSEFSVYFPFKNSGHQ